MSKNKKLIKNELEALSKLGNIILLKASLDEGGQLSKEEKNRIESHDDFKQYSKKSSGVKADYQQWFTKASSVVKRLIPDRYEEFIELYRKKKKNNKTDTTMPTISDYLLGVKLIRGKKTMSTFGNFFSKMETQINILQSCIPMIDSKLSNIEGILLFELFDTELQAAKDLLKKKYYRAAGALAGVTLEIHLSKVCANHGLTFRKNNPTISNFNEELKNNSIIDTPTWRLIQRLGDIRNLSVHSKEREPRDSEIEDLIIGCEKLISELN